MNGPKFAPSCRHMKKFAGTLRGAQVPAILCPRKESRVGKDLVVSLSYFGDETPPLPKRPIAFYLRFLR